MVRRNCGGRLEFSVGIVLSASRGCLVSFNTTVGVVLLKDKLELVDPNSAKSLASVDLHQSRDWQWLHKVSTSDSIAKG